MKQTFKVRDIRLANEHRNNYCDDKGGFGLPPYTGKKDSSPNCKIYVLTTVQSYNPISYEIRLYLPIVILQNDDMARASSQQQDHITTEPWPPNWTPYNLPPNLG